MHVSTVKLTELYAQNVLLHNTEVLVNDCRPIHFRACKNSLSYGSGVVFKAVVNKLIAYWDYSRKKQCQYFYVCLYLYL